MAFAPVFGRPFAPTFDRHAAAAAAAADWWTAGGAPTPIAVYQPKGAASLAASYVNLINPGTYDAAPGIAPTLDATGWVFNGTQYLLTGIIPKDGQDQAVLVRYAGAGVANGYLVGVMNNATSKRFALIPSWTGSAFGERYYANLELVSITNTASNANGVLAVSGTSGYLNGNIDKTGIGPGSGLAITGGVLIGGMLQDGIGYHSFFLGSILAVAIWNTSTGHATWMPAVAAAVELI